ncbi:calcium-binding protein [Candidatus Uhrbacteria bacterium RIFCSPLOWO2_01_FULL_55_36]|uniref:Calcium-binding protein n=1 Tax=Candidatus Uhrbacteria bacterium RIFCSPLOWO2_01_FULL_55_36 TaxID=1802404 RepID=A0A1F7V1U8_9BACT|nr:MAG: calcium-binding protein [Candidatus Uhrbacteria bacterium RIFCSPLOWO2_01_FULL_55_36]
MNEDKKREQRIEDEVIVDCYGPEEQALGWYYYLHDTVQCPFKAKCVKERPISPLRKGDIVEVTGMPKEEECEHEMFATVTWEGRTLAVPFAQLEPVHGTDAKTRQAVADWHYWVGMRYEF